MSDDAALALRELRDAVRAPFADTDAFTFALSKALDVLGIAPAPSRSAVVSLSTMPPPARGAPRAVQRLMPGIQHALVGAAPTFLPALDARGRALLDAFFVPPRRPEADPAARAVARSVALAAYLSLTALLAPTPPAPLPAEARPFVLGTLAALSAAYGIGELYHAVFGDGAPAAATAALMWDDAVRAASGLPAKAANAVGRWRDAGWAGDVPSALVPRPYFDGLVRHLESLAYQLACKEPAETSDAALRAVFEKLAAIGLLTPAPGDTRSPSLLPPFLPPSLAHLHPADASPLPPYSTRFFPALLLPLPSAALAALARGLVLHLAFRLVPPTSPPLEPGTPDERVKRASIVLAGFLGPPAAGGDAWGPILSAVLDGRRATGLSDTAQHASRRTVVAWAAAGGQKVATAFIDAVMDVWADPKRIKFDLYSQQFALTHTLLLSLSLLPRYHPHLLAASRTARLMAAIHAYLSHPEPKIRRLGMLVGEVLSELTIDEDPGDDARGPSEEEEMQDLAAGLEVDEETGQPKRRPPRPPPGARRLRFTGMWEGSGDGRDECRWLRRCIGVKDDDAVLSPDPSATAWLLGWDGGNDESEEEPLQPSAVEAPPSPSPPRSPRLRHRKTRSRPKIVILDDDQAGDLLEGYASSPASSRSPSPSPSELEEVRADPTLAIDATKKKKIKRPVYVRQLVDLLRSKDNADAIDMGLEWGEGLIRAKRSFGGEVSENAVDVAAATIALANPYHLDNFEARRQGLVTALVACSPRTVSPFLSEQYFSTSYSLLQKSVMLTGIAMGARELAGLPVPDAPRMTRRVDFPTKTLPPALHARYVTPADDPRSAEHMAGQLEDAVSGMRNLLLSKGAQKGEEEVPEIARERRLRVGTSKRRKVAEEGTSAADAISAAAPAQPPVVPYAQVAAEYFILPLVNRFWEHFQDASTRESRALAAGARYRGAGTGMVLSPMALEKFLLTLALLLHAARHAPTFLAVLVPTALELALTVGARQLGGGSARSGMGGGGLGGDLDGNADDASAPETQVVGASLELALATLDPAVELDQGRTLALDSPALVLATGEWARAVFEATDAGVRTAGAGGAREGRLRAAAAGVVVKIAEIGEKWGHLGLAR